MADNNTPHLPAQRLDLGSRVTLDGSVYTLVGLAGPRATLRDSAGALSAWLLADLVSSPGFQFLGRPQTGPCAPATPLSAVPKNERKKAEEREAHVLEMACGYTTGHAATAPDGQPRPEYDPQRTTQGDRVAAKARELGVSEVSLWRQMSEYRKHGVWALVDKRTVRSSPKRTKVDPRVVECLVAVLEDLRGASNVTRVKVRRMVRRRLDDEHGGQVQCPPESTFNRLYTEVTRNLGFDLSAKTRRSIASRPQAPYGSLKPTRPGQFVVFDTTTLDVFAMCPVTFQWMPVQLTIAQDLYTGSIVGWRITVKSTKAVDAGMVLFDVLRPKTMRPGWSKSAEWRYHGVPANVLIEAHKLDGETLAGIPALNPETVVVDRGKIYVSRAFQDACLRLGINFQPTPPYMGAHKGRLERTFRTIRQSFLEYLPGYKGPDVYSRGDNVEDDTHFLLQEIEEYFAEWVATVWQRRFHAGLHLPHIERLRLSPNDMYDEGIARAGLVVAPFDPTLYLELLPTEWRRVNHYGVEVLGLRYDDMALNPYRNATSPYNGEYAGKWPLRYDPRDRSKVYFQDVATGDWHALGWVHAHSPHRPFDDITLAHVKALVVSRGGNPRDQRELADELESFLNGIESRVVLERSERRVAREAFIRLQQVAKDAQGAPAVPADRVLDPVPPDAPADFDGDPVPVGPLGDSLVEEAAGRLSGWDDTDDDEDVDEWR